MPSEIPQTPDYAAMDDAALTEAFEAARAIGAEFASRAPETFTAEDVAAFEACGATVQAIQTEQHTREIRAAKITANAELFASLPAAEPAAAPAETVTAPESAPEPVQVPEVPSVAAMAAGAPVAPEVPEERRSGDAFSIELSSDGAGVLRKQVGEESSVRELTAASLRLFGQFGKVGGGRAGVKANRAIGQFRRDRGAELTLPGTEQGDYAVIQHARDQRRLDGGSLMRTWERSANANAEAGIESLTAAAGWCAPSENRYELCSLWDIDGIFDAPTTTAPRGGINYTNDVTWAAINDASITSFTRLTEAQVIAGATKSCTELPCPEFTDRRLDVAVTCITGSFLQSAGYPEVVSTWTDGLLTKHQYEINKDIIGQVETYAGPAITLPPQGAVAPGSTPDTSATASILAGLEVAAIDMRERSNMSFNTTLEVALPRWVLAQFRADISRRNAWYADPFTLSNQTIISWFTTRNIRPQFVRGYQDAQAGQDPANGYPGDITEPITPITALPTTVQFLIYPAGAIVIAREDVVTLTNVYDSTNLSQNLYTALFTEEGYAPIFPCGEVRAYAVSACPSGATGHQVWTSCATPAPAA
jgi:hypothetical protein